MPTDTEREPRPRFVCSRDGLWLREKASGGLRHNAARWTARSCGQEPDAITYVEYLERNPWLLRNFR